MPRDGGVGEGCPDTGPDTGDCMEIGDVHDASKSAIGSVITEDTVPRSRREEATAKAE